MKRKSLRSDVLPENLKRMQKIYLVVDTDGVQRLFSAYGDYTKIPEQEINRRTGMGFFKDYKKELENTLCFMMLAGPWPTPEMLNEYLILALDRACFPKEKTISLLHPTAVVEPENVVPSHMHNRMSLEKNELHTLVSSLEKKGFHIEDNYKPNFTRY